MGVATAGVVAFGARSCDASGRPPGRATGSTHTAAVRTVAVMVAILWGGSRAIKSLRGRSLRLLVTHSPEAGDALGILNSAFSIPPRALRRGASAARFPMIADEIAPAREIHVSKPGLFGARFDSCDARARHFAILAVCMGKRRYKNPTALRLCLHPGVCGCGSGRPAVVRVPAHAGRLV